MRARQTRLIGVKILFGVKGELFRAVLGTVAVLAAAVPAYAQENETWRSRVTLGPQIFPSYPGSDEFKIGPFVNFDRKRGNEPFDFEAPDESIGVALYRSGRLSLGPVVNWQHRRTAQDLGAAVPTVGFSLEPGVFVALNVGENLRLRSEIRKGVTGHKGLVGLISADIVLRDGDMWLISIGPRVTLGDERYQSTYFEVAPAVAISTGLPVYRASGGVHAYGAAASFLRQLSRRWGINTYARYDRLTGRASNSPLVRHFGSENQFSAGLALSYILGRSR